MRCKTLNFNIFTIDRGKARALACTVHTYIHTYIHTSLMERIKDAKTNDSFNNYILLRVFT